MDDMRRFQRIHFDARVELALGQQSLPGLLRDISLKGALIMLSDTSALLDVGETGLLTVRFDQGDVTLSMDVKVAFFDPTTLACGLSVIALDIESASHLRRLVELNLGEPLALQRELSNLVEAYHQDHA
ncbi:MAG: PilZ domain-containing protein [Saccharospirillum sp.]